MGKKNFSKGVEGLVDPISVGSLHFMQSFNTLLPKSIQKQFVQSAAKKTPYMGFVVEPYSLFLCYEIADAAMAQSLLPKGFKLIKTKIFDTDQPKYYCIFGCFRSHTSAFWGSRVELYAIAQDENTGLLSWIILDYDTDTISYDTKHGLCSPNASRSTVTVDYRGTVLIDVKRTDKSRAIVLDADITKGIMTPLNQRLWLEGNLSIGYGSNFSDSADVFSLKFEAEEVKQALNIPTNSVHIQTNSWYPGLCASKPAHVVCFPYAQHFVSDSPGHTSSVKDAKELQKAVKHIDFDAITVFSANAFKTMFIVGALSSFAITTLFIVLWLTK